MIVRLRGHTYFTLPAFTQNAKGCIIYTVSVRRSALQILPKELQRTMEPTSKKTVKSRMTREQYMRRKRLRLARNWAVLILICAGIVALMTRGILWLLPKAHALIAGPVPFTARNYDSSSYVFDADDDRLVVVNANLALEEEPAPELAVADDATGEQLEAEAASAYRSMAEAAQADGVELNLVTGWQDADARTAAYEARLTAYSAENSRLSAEEAADHTASLQPAASTSEQGTGYCADILSPDCTEKTAAFAETRAYEWLTAYAAEYGFILRWPEDRQSATGMVYAPWHWRYVGVENACAIRESGLALEEFLALERAKS